MFNLFSSRRNIVLMSASLLLLNISAANAALVTIDSQSINQYKSLGVSNFGTGVFNVGGNETFVMPVGETDFSNSWSGSESYGGVTVNGSSQVTYSFTGDQFSFYSNIDTSHTGTSSLNITGLPRGSANYNISFTLNEAANVFYDLIGYADDNGRGGSGGSPYAGGRLEMFTGDIDSFYGDKIYANVFTPNTAWDSTVGNGAESFNQIESMRLEAGEYRLSGSMAVQNLYHQRIANVGSSEQSAELDMSLRFEALEIAEVSEPGAMSILALGLLGLASRRFKRQA
jgi:hypothetical protein